MHTKNEFASIGFSANGDSSTTGLYRDRQVIFAQGDKADAMFRIQSGHVRLALASNGSKEASIAILRAGDCFGEGCLLSNARRSHSATSIHASTIVRVGKRAMVQRLRSEPALGRSFVRHLLHRLNGVESDLAAQLVNTSERRLARLLLQLSGFAGSPGRLPAGVHVDQGTLAQAVGTTRSRVSYFMNRFRKLGYIDYNGSLRVRKALALFLDGKPARASRAASRPR
jgi:CRP/FNR family cyclic AMP-dependent transcriptional regulator